MQSCHRHRGHPHRASAGDRRLPSLGRARWPADARRGRRLRRRIGSWVGRKDLACIIYTSGTGGAPRGVIASIMVRSWPISPARPTSSQTTSAGTKRSSCPSFRQATPTSTPAGSTSPVGLGAQIYYAESLEKLAANIEEVRPTIMVVVPRLFEMLRARILKTIEGSGGIFQISAPARAIDRLQRNIEGRKNPLGPAHGGRPFADLAQARSARNSGDG